MFVRLDSHFTLFEQDLDHSLFFQVVYFAATFPYVILLILLVTGLVQEGAWDGVRYFIMPQWDQLLNIQVHTSFIIIHMARFSINITLFEAPPAASR